MIRMIKQNRINKMGNYITNGSAVPQNWKAVTPSLYQNTDSQELIEVSSTLLPADVTLSDYSDWYEARLSPSTKYVRVIDYKLKGSICCNSKKEVVVFTERIYSLDQLELSPEQVNYIFHESLIAFRQLFQEFGLFLITDRMIGVNEKGVAKVWINQNYARNHLEDDDDNKPSEEAIVNGLVRTLDVHSKTSRLDTAFRCYTSKRTLDSALSFIQRLQNQQELVIHEVFLNRGDFEAYRARSTINSKQTMDFSFAAKQEKLQISFHSKMDQSKRMGSITSSVHSAQRQSHKFISTPPLPVRQSLPQATASEPLSQHPQPHQHSPITNLPHMHNRISNSTQPNFHKAIRSSIEDAQPQRHSAGITVQRLADPPISSQHARMSTELKAESKRHPHKINIVTPPPKHKAAPHNPPKPPAPPAPAVTSSQQVQKNTMTTIASLNQRTSRQNSGVQHQLSRVNQLDFTLNRISMPVFPDFDRSRLKKSDSERLLEYRQAEMYRSIPKVDSVVLISRSDANHDVIDIANPPENYRISLIESTIERGLTSSNK